MATQQSTAAPQDQSTAVTRHPAFGADNAAGWLDACSDSFGRLAAILRAIERATSDGGADAGEIGELAAAGWQLARDMQNTADCWSCETGTACREDAQ